MLMEAPPLIQFANHWSNYASNYFRLVVFDGATAGVYETDSISGLTNEWHHIMINYYSDSSTGDCVVTREGGAIFHQSLGVDFPMLSFDQLAVGEMANRNYGSQAIFRVDNIQITKTAPIPEPSTILLIGTGLVGFVAFTKKFKK